VLRRTDRSQEGGQRREAAAKAAAGQGSERTEREGFEPSTHLSAGTRFPVAFLRPLGHLSEGGQRSTGVTARSAGARPELLRTSQSPYGLELLRVREVGRRAKGSCAKRGLCSAAPLAQSLRRGPAERAAFGVTRKAPLRYPLGDRRTQRYASIEIASTSSVCGFTHVRATICATPWSVLEASGA
jgi:hypothetical protein